MRGTKVEEPDPESPERAAIPTVRRRNAGDTAAVRIIGRAILTI